MGVSGTCREPVRARAKIAYGSRVTFRKTASSPETDVRGALHDVSNALTVLLGWIEEARAADATPESTAYALRIIEQRARMARILARRAIGDGSDDSEASFSNVLEDAVASLRVEASKRSVRIKMENSAPLSTVYGGDAVSQIATNLLLNALAFSPAGSEVVIRAFEDSEWAELEVCDAGQGVPASEAVAIFEGLTTRKGGAGVGLSYARSLARARGGELSLKRFAEEGKGALFRLSWPRANHSPRPPVSASVLRMLTGMHVLVVEDDAAVVQLLEASLETRGATVIVARNVSEMIARLSEGEVDAALLDMSPLGGDLNGAIAQIRSKSPEAALIVITGNADGVAESAAAGAVRLVRKPFEIGEIVTALIETAAKK